MPLMIIYTHYVAKKDKKEEKNGKNSRNRKKYYKKI